MATIEPSPSEKLPRKSPPSLKQILHKITASKKTLISIKVGYSPTRQNLPVKFLKTNMIYTYLLLMGCYIMLLSILYAQETKDRTGKRKRKHVYSIYRLRKCCFLLRGVSIYA